MKVAIQCDSPLLQRSLELFLDGHLSSIRQCDILIRDKDIRDDVHPTFVIGVNGSCDLVKPFSKAQLLHALTQKFESCKQQSCASIEEEPLPAPEEAVSFEILERHIDKLTREYQANIIKAIRAFYEK
ncbi:hypothetical protein [Sulfuricurvum sp.]|uniref:hypothetical protein n=1 Tax=Sulfuricurvum sp. TaxID=2025608 RepID=UPI0026073D15|nr:hypothetical protein [Sulfuricurvum sp.]MDD2267208.1 hypothetical protein [Sulfuricurvum sp.]MDD2782793.1 hypothetical protein [Sulfuricurvum sp.]HZF71082.1 hypothetical protein [Sulfuricurvum sp.]